MNVFVFFAVLFYTENLIELFFKNDYLSYFYFFFLVNLITFVA